MVSREHLRVFALPNILFFGQICAFQLFFMFIPIHLRGIGLANWQIGVLMGLLPVTAILLSAPFGIFSDRIVPKHMVVVSLLLMAAFAGLLGSTVAFSALIVVFLIGGTARNLFFVSLYSLYYKTIGEKNKSKKIALAEISRMVAYGIGPFAGGALLATLAFSALFGIAFLAVIPLILLALMLKRTKGAFTPLSEYKKDFRNSKFLLVFAAYFFLALHFGAEDTVHALFLEQTVGLSFQEIGFVFLWIAAVLVCFNVIGAFALGRGRGIKGILLAGLAASAIGNIIYLWSFSLPMVLLSRLVHEGGDAAAILSIRVVTPSLTRTERVGGALGTITLASYAGSLVGALISGFSADAYGYAMPFAITGAALLVPLAIFASMFAGRGKKNKSSGGIMLA